MEAEEVDAVLEREDLRLAVQAKAERLDVCLDLFEDLPEQQLEQGGASSTNRCAMTHDASAGGIGV